MKIAESQKMRIVAETPIFVGNGETLKPLSYLLHQDAVHMLDEDKFFAQLSPEKKERYLSWIEPLLSRLSQIDNQIAVARGDFDRRRHLQRERRDAESQLSLRTFITDIMKARPLDVVRPCEMYVIRCNVPPERDGFRLHLKAAPCQPYLPGTEIKGALRTAVLYTLVAEEKSYPVFRSQLADFRDTFRSGMSSREKIRKLGKVASDLEAKLLRGLKDDAKFDFFRMIQVSDSTPLSSSALCIELTQMVGTNRYTKTWVETLVPGSEMQCDVALGDPGIVLKELGLTRLGEWVSIPKVLEACYIRSRDTLAEEAEYFADQPRISQLIATLQQKNEPHAPLMRLGQGQGFLSVTVDLPVKRRDKQLFEEAIREGVSFQRHWRTQAGNFPKTRRVVTDVKGDPVTVLGWTKLRLYADES